jgi:copper chaperone CopZ
MINAVIVIIGIGITLCAVRASIKHFKGEGSCCGGGSGIITDKKKLTGTKLGQKTISIEGMHCDNCRRHVQNALNKLDGAAATVNLKKQQAVVAYDREISDDTLKAAVEQAGYTVISIV